MAIYIPGWYEQMAQSGSIQGLGDLIGRKIAPDFRANQDLQRMIQQNPAVMEQFSNMDPAALAQIQKTIGFVNQAPLTSLPAGAERKQRELKQAALGRVMATPQGAEEVDANLTGTLTSTQRKAADLNIQGAEQDLQYKKLDFEKLTDDVGIGKLLNAEKERTILKLQEYRKNNKIDTISLVDRIATNKATQSDFEMFSVISSEPGMGEALNKALEFRQMRDNQKNSLYLRTAGMQDDFLRLAVQTVNQASQEYSRASAAVNKVVSDAALAKISVEEALKTDPQRKAMYDEAIRIRDESKQLLDSYRPLVKSGFERFGVKFPEVTPQATGTTAPAAPLNETPQQRLARIKKEQGIN